MDEQIRDGLNDAVHNRGTDKLQDGLKAFFPDQKDLDEAEKVSVSKALTQIAWMVTDYRRGLLAAGMPEIVADVLATELQDKLWTMGLTGRPTL